MAFRFPALWSLCVLCSLASAEEAPRPIDLTCWKLTLPIDTDLPSRPDEIEQPRLASFLDPLYFYLSADRTGMVFRAPCDGVSTKGSTYPRCELREMTADGRTEAAWSTTDDNLHILTMRPAITRLPTKKPHVVCAQIHDAKSDCLMVRLEGTKLFVERKPDGDVMLDRNYSLGKPIDVRIEAGKGRIRLWYEAALKLDWEVERQKCYFKAGCYVQSNATKGDGPGEFGEVVFHHLELLRR